jgi:predicted ferric reductase
VRVFRTWKVGSKRSVVTDVTPEIVRIDVPHIRWGLEAGQHAYINFPTLSRLRPWENHPFSIVPTALLSSSVPPAIVHKSGTETPNSSSDVEKSAAAKEIQIQRSISASSTSSPVKDDGRHTLTNTSGITLFIRKGTGITRYLKPTNALTTFVEGPYTSQHTKSLFTNDRLLVVAGGIGITGAFPYLWASINSKLYWSVKASNEGLVQEFENAIGNSIAERDVRVGERFVMSEVLEREVETLGGKGSLGVVVCGPGGMCDELRAAVVQVSRRGDVVIDLHVEAFAW